MKRCSQASLNRLRQLTAVGWQFLNDDIHRPYCFSKRFAEWLGSDERMCSMEDLRFLPWLMLKLLTVFWDVTPCSLVGKYRRFGGTFYLHIQASSIAVVMKSIIFWDMTPCSLSCNRRFGGTYRLHLQGWRNKQEPASKQNSVCHLLVLASLFLRTWKWWRYIPLKRRLQLNRLHGVISQKMIPLKMNCLCQSMFISAYCLGCRDYFI
jgi:hypothetical protein